MPRRKTRSDEEVLDAAITVVRHHGVDRLTFSAAAAATGLSGATLVQRFGTKHALKQRTLLRAWDQLDARTAALAASAPLTPEGAIDLLVGLSGTYDDINRYVEDLLVLREDLRDPVLRARGAAWERELIAALDARCGPGSGRLLAAHWQGAVTWWAFRPESGPLEDDLRESLAALVERL